MSLLGFKFGVIKVVQLKWVLWLAADFTAGVKFLMEADFLFTTNQNLELVSTLSPAHKVLGTLVPQG